MDENHQKTWIVLTEDEKAELEMVLFEMTLYDLGLRWEINEIFCYFVHKYLLYA